MHCHRYRHYCGHRSIAQQRGAALIVAMMVFALATALVVAMKSEFNRFYQRSANVLLEEQSQAYLRGAEDLAALALLADYDQDKEAGLARDDLQEVWATPPPPYALDDVGWMRGSLEDLQGRFNLNVLAERMPESGSSATKDRFTPAQQQFIRLLQALQEPLVGEQDAILITESVSDWMDADQKPSLDGAEDDYYYGQTPTYRAANSPISSVSELRAVAHVTPEIYEALIPWVTVLPDPSTKLNIHTAPATVLRSINEDNNLSPLSEADGDSLVEYREDSGFVDVSDFLANPAFEGKRDKMAATAKLLGQSSSYFLLLAELEVADRNMRLYSVLQRNNRSIGAIARANGSL